MAVARSHSKKSPSQNPSDFYACKQAGGATGSASGRVGDRLSGGPQRELVNGKKSLK